MTILTRLRALERVTRPENPEFAAAVERRWRELPDQVKTPGQVLGRQCRLRGHPRRLPQVRFRLHAVLSLAGRQPGPRRRPAHPAVRRGPGGAAGKAPRPGRARPAHRRRGEPAGPGRPRGGPAGHAVPRPGADELHPRGLRLRLPGRTRHRPGRPVSVRAAVVRRALRPVHVRAQRDRAAGKRAGAQPVPGTVRRHVHPAEEGTRCPVLPRAQHDRDSREPRRGRRGDPRLPRDGVPHVLLPAGGARRR